jgi:hypothetical protein
MKLKIRKIMMFMYQQYQETLKNKAGKGRGIDGGGNGDFLQLTDAPASHLVASQRFARDGQYTPEQFNTLLDFLNDEADKGQTNVVQAPWPPVGNVSVPKVTRLNTEEWMNDLLSSGASPVNSSSPIVAKTKQPAADPFSPLNLNTSASVSTPIDVDQLRSMTERLTSDQKDVASRIDGVTDTLSNTFGDFDHLISDLPLFSGFADHGDDGMGSLLPSPAPEDDHK